MRLPQPSTIPEFDLPYDDFVSGKIPLRIFRFPDGRTDPRRTIVCIPGMSASGLSFARLRPLAKDYDFRLLSGPIDECEGSNRVSFAAAVLALLSELDRPVLLGTSFGGLVAIDVAFRAKSGMRGLVLPAAFARNHAFPPPLRPAELLLTHIQWLGRPLAPISTRFVGGRGLDRNAASELTREAAEMTARARRQRLKEVFETDLRSMLPELDLPALVIHGRKDRLVPRRDALELAARLPICEYHEIDRAHHVPYISHPDTFNAILARFLARLF